jgi:hypothetical protein
MKDNGSVSGISNTYCTNTSYSRYNTTAALIPDMSYVCSSLFLGGQTIAFKDSNYTNNPSGFKEHMSGSYLYYELQTPITVTFSSNLQNSTPPLLSAPLNINISTLNV